jgi:hypothetical protein
MNRKTERLYWQDTTYDRLDRQKIVEMVLASGYELDDEDIAVRTRSELVDVLIDTAVEAEYDAEEAHADYPLRRPIRTPVPPRLAETSRRVHLRWEDDWRKALERLLDHDAPLEVPKSADPGDVVVTVLGCRPPLVAAVERIEDPGRKVPVRGRVLIAQPVTWGALWYRANAAAPAPRSARLPRRLGAQMLAGLRSALENPEPTFVVAGDCASYRTASRTVIDALARLQTDHPDAVGLHSWCASCDKQGSLELHFERPVHDNVELEIQDHLDDVVNLCGDCHRLAHPHSIQSQRRTLQAQRDVLQPECPGCGARGARRILWGLPSPGDLADPSDVIWAGCVTDGPFPADWRCRTCGEDFVTVTTSQIRRGIVHGSDIRDGG